MKSLFLIIFLAFAGWCSASDSVEEYERKAVQAAGEGNLSSSFYYQQMANQERELREIARGNLPSRSTSYSPSIASASGGSVVLGSSSSSSGTSPVVIGLAVVLGLWLISKLA